MKINYVLATLVLTGLTLTSMTGCNSSNSKAAGISLIDPANLDTSEAPQNNFFNYVNGGWMKKNPIPASESAWGSFKEIEASNQKILREVLEAAAADTKAVAGSNTGKVGNFYSTAMDSAKLNKDGIQPLAAEFAKINAIKDLKGVAENIAGMQKYFFSPLYSFFADQDQKNSTQVIPYLYQGGTSMPDRDYYLKDDPQMQKNREEYVKHIEKMFVFCGDKPEVAKANAATVMHMETELAKAQRARVDLRDPYKNYNKKSIAQLTGETGIDWSAQLSVMGLPAVDSIVVGQPEFIVAAGQMLKKSSVNDWKTYLRWRLLTNAAPYLSDEIVLENFNFFESVLNGTKELKPRWKRSLQTIDRLMGEALGEVYIQKAFPGDAKQHALDMVNNMQEVFRSRIKNLDWMSDSTKQQAEVKLDKFMKKIGYPDKMRDYSKLDITRDAFVLNVMRASEFEFNRMINKIGKPVDKTEWGMSPSTVNAYYNPSLNEIVFPAGILQPPFYNPKADDAMNYGAMGAIIGHEMTHGFDDQGRQYDAEGNLKDWWTGDDGKKFNDLASKIITQFDAYTVLDSVHVNGKLTQGENIADLGGLRIAYESFKKTKQGQSNEKIDGFTPDQRFFIAWAQAWRISRRPESMKQRIITDVHSPGIWRCNGPLSNMPEFYTAFNVKPGDKMYRDDKDRIVIW